MSPTFRSITGIKLKLLGYNFRKIQQSSGWGVIYVNVHLEKTEKTMVAQKFIFILIRSLLIIAERNSTHFLQSLNKGHPGHEHKFKLL